MVSVRHHHIIHHSQTVPTDTFLFQCIAVTGGSAREPIPVKSRMSRFIVGGFLMIRMSRFRVVVYLNESDESIQSG